ncbi:Rapamycin-insensitive companion of mTOR, N-term-domain-containing protein [Coprinopsis sp. MPI-PUGE-AT-0042]|nr:Rapamycin-insensitive companion of mTOR, N-term-domain-containing protein [Coprinopsis sp. MPI-PUGE-AT-0042]
MPVSGTSAASSATLFSSNASTKSRLDRETGISVNAMEGMNANEKLEVLNEQLAIQNRIKEGAENLLSNTLADGVREQVASELGSANSKIEAIRKRNRHTSQLETTLSKHQATAAAEKKLQAKASIPALRNEKGDDSKTVHQNALSALQELERPQPELPANRFKSRIITEMKTAEDLEADHRRIFLMDKVIDILKRNVRVRYELKVLDLFRMTEGCLADGCSKRCRATAYRLVRHALVDSDAVTLLDRSLDWYIVKTLQRDNKHAKEKEQALKLIRTIIEISTTNRDGSIATNRIGTVHLSEAVMRAVVAVAEHPEDPFRPICIRNSDRNPLVYSYLCTGKEHPSSSRLPPYCGFSPDTTISHYRDRFGNGPVCDNRMRMANPQITATRSRTCAKVVQMMLRTWSGLVYFCLDDMAAVRSLVDTLRIPSLETRDLILDMFFDLLNIKTPEWYQTFIDGRRLTMYRRRSAFPSSQSQHEPPERDEEALKLVDQYLALLLVILTNAGLCDALVAMTEESTMGTNLSRKATLLLAEVLAMGKPSSTTIRGRQNPSRAIPGVFAMATDYENKEHRIVGTSAVSAIDSFNRNKSRLEGSNPKFDSSRPRANSVEDAVRRGQRQVEQVKLKMSMQMDDKSVPSCDYRDPMTKDFTRWDFDALQALIEGPLLAPKRMEEATRGTRFIRRLMSFYLPFNQRFSAIKRTSANVKWVKLGCTLMNTLTSTPEGVRYLANDDQLLAQLMRAFAQLDPFNGVSDKRPEGIELLEKFKIFTAFYHLSELRSREDLITTIIDHLDYGIDGHSRIVLSKALTSSYKTLRLYATQRLGLSGSKLAYGKSMDTSTTAYATLRPFPRFLQMLVDMQPTIDHLGDIGHPLTLKFMSATLGFRYLYDTGYINREIDVWFNERNIDYLVLVEVYLARVFSPAEDDEPLIPEFDGSVPPHFYGELVKTDLGCQVLQEKGHFSDFAQLIRMHGHESEDPDMIIKLKSVLENIGASEGGLHFLEEEEVIADILDILEQSPIPSVRGTCFFVLGLISSTSQGAEVLDDYHWEATLSAVGLPNRNLHTVGYRRLCFSPYMDSQAIQNLSNTVIANAASRTLTKLKAKSESKSAFHSPEMLYRALHIISTQRYRFPVRRYIMDLFNVELNPQLSASLNTAAQKLKVSPSQRPPKVDTLRLSVLPALLFSRINIDSLLTVKLGKHIVKTSKMVRYAAAAVASNPEKSSRAHGEYLRTHFKNMREVAAALTGQNLQKALIYLGDVKDHKRVIPFRRFAGGVGRTGQAKDSRLLKVRKHCYRTRIKTYRLSQGRWPEKSIKFITRLLKNAESNADAKNLSVDDLIIKSIVVQQAPGHPCHVEVILIAPDVEVEKATDKVAAPSLGALNRRQVARRRIEAARA